MAANATGVLGAMCDIEPTNKLNALNCGIGFGVNSVYGPPLTAGMDAGETVGVARIGSAPPYTAAEACGFPGNAVTLRVALSPVSPGGTFSDGSTNATGKTVPTGGGALDILVADPDAASWEARVISNGGTVSAATSNAVSAFVTSAKAAGYWTKLNRVNLMCGNQLAAALVPLKVGGGSATETNVNFVSGDYTEATGITGNGTTKYLRTGIVPSTMLTDGDTHMAVYNRASSAAGGGGTMGATVSPNFFEFLAPNTDSRASSDQYNGTAAAGRVSSGVLGTPFGFLVGSRTSAASHVIYRNGVQENASSGSGGSLAGVNVEVYLFAINGNGSANSFIPQSLGGYSIGSGLTAADVTAYNTHMQAFQTALGRNV